MQSSKNPRSGTKDHLTEAIWQPQKRVSRKSIRRPRSFYISAAVILVFTIFMMHRTLGPAVQRVRSRRAVADSQKIVPELKNCRAQSFLLFGIPNNKVFFFRGPKDPIRPHLHESIIILDHRVYSPLGDGERGVLIYLTPGGHFEIEIIPHLSTASLKIFTCARDHSVEEKIRVAVLEATDAKTINEGSAEGEGEDMMKEWMTEFQSLFEEYYEEESRKSEEGAPQKSEEKVDPAGHLEPILDTLTPRDLRVNWNDAGSQCELLRGVKVLHSAWSSGQLVEVIQRTDKIGCLLLNRVTHFCDSRDNEDYIKALVQGVVERAINLEKNNNRGATLGIIGGGDGWAAGWMLNFREQAIRALDVVEMDPVVSQVTRKFFHAPDQTINPFEDPRVSWNYEKTETWLARIESGRLDGIIINSLEHGQNTTNTQYTKDFYTEIFRILKPGGSFSQKMGTWDRAHFAGQKALAAHWRQLGFLELNRWTVYVPNCEAFSLQ